MNRKTFCSRSIVTLQSVHVILNKLFAVMVNIKNRCTQSESRKNDFVTRRYRGHLWRLLSSGLSKEVGIVPVLYTFAKLVQTPGADWLCIGLQNITNVDMGWWGWQGRIEVERKVPSDLKSSCFRAGLRSLPYNAKMHYNFANFLKDTSQPNLAVHHYQLALW